MVNQRITISTDSIVRVFLIALALWLAYAVRGTLLLVLISFILATIMQPLVLRAEQYRIPRSVSVLTVYALGFLVFAAVGWALMPILSQEVTQISQNFGDYWNKVVAILPQALGNNIKQTMQTNITSIADAARSGLALTVTGLASTLHGLISVIGSVVIILVLAFYFVVEERAIKKALVRILPITHVPFAERMIVNSQFWLGGWARGQIILSFLVGTLVFISLTVIGVPYAFALAALAGLVEFIPYVGPISSAVFGIFFALTISPTVGLITAIAYYVIQILENNIFIPKVMQKTAGVNPVLSFTMILLAYEALGVVGVFLGVPIASLIMAIMDSLEPRAH